MESLIETKGLPHRCQYDLFRYMEGKYHKLVSTVYKDRATAYKAVEEFVNFWQTDAVKNDRYYRKRYNVTQDNFIVVNAPAYRIEGFDDPETY